MKLKELEFVGGTLYLNIVSAEVTKTEMLPVEKAVRKYGELEVIEHIAYVPDGKVEETSAQEPEKGGKKASKPGTDIVILKAE